MKLSIFVAACMAIVAVQSESVAVDHTVVADKSFVEKQRFIFEILLRVDKDLLIEEWIKIAGKLITDKAYYTEYTELMDHFHKLYEVGSILPRGQFFSPLQRMHTMQSYGLFNFFYYAKDWETFVHNVAWARLNVNEGMFVHALTLTVIHHEDMQGIILPQIYEIFPQMFFGSKYIVATEKFNWDTWNRQIMLEKEFKTIYGEEYAEAAIGKRFYLKDWKMWQWWKLMGLNDGWHLEDKSVPTDNYEAVDPLWTSIYSKLKMAWLPVDYTREFGIFNKASKLSYFTEDVRWNAYWYYLNMDYSFTLSLKEFHLDKDRRGEWWIFNVQQVLARYYMERLSQGLGSFDTLSWYGVVRDGYDPQLISYTGNGFTFRKNYWQVESYQNLGVLNKIINIERRLDDAIASGKFVLTDGTVVDLTLPQSIDFVGKVMQGNVNKIDHYAMGHWFMLANKFLNGQEYHDFIVEPTVLMNYETMLRDPLSYSLFKIVVNKFYQFKYQLHPYTKQELLFPDVNIVDVETSKLTTYFELADYDVSTLLSDKLVFNDGQLVWDKSLLFRQSRLASKDFNYTMTVTSKTAQEVVISAFLGPEFNEFGKRMGLSENRENYVQIDKFIFNLDAGENSIHRSSKDFAWTSGDPHTYSELYNYLQTTSDGKYEFYKNISVPHSLFPKSLVLPHGWVNGMPMGLFFMTSPYTAEYKQYATYDSSYLPGIGSGVRFVDNMPFGYPLDRKIVNLLEFYVPNMFYKNVKIYHLDKYDKYYPMKYENYGTFDTEY